MWCLSKAHTWNRGARRTKESLADEEALAGVNVSDADEVEGAAGVEDKTIGFRARLIFEVNPTGHAVLKTGRLALVLERDALTHLDTKWRASLEIE